MLLIITLRFIHGFTCGERKICSTIKKSQNIMDITVGIEAVSKRCSIKKLQKISPNSQGITHASLFFNKVACNFTKNDSGTDDFL